MARFKYLGERLNFIGAQNLCLVINIPKKDGTIISVDAPSPDGFVIGVDIGVDITDAHSIRVMQADPRFQQLS